MTTPEADAGRGKCGAPTRGGSEGGCGRPAGWGTPHPGIGRCKLHGGSTPTHVESARRVQAEAVVRRLLDDPGAAPVTDPVGALQALAGRLSNAVDVMGARVNDLERELRYEAPGAGTEQLRSEVAVWERLIGQLRGLLVDMARLGIEDRVVRLEEGRGRLIGEVMLSFMAEFGVIFGMPGVEQDARARELMGRKLSALSEGRVLSGGG